MEHILYSDDGTDTLHEHVHGVTVDRKRDDLNAKRAMTGNEKALADQNA